MKNSKGVTVALTGADRVWQYVKLARPQQWTKNVIVFAPLVFSFNLFDPHVVVAGLLGFLAFCLMSSSVYALNDVVDAEKDSLHPRKRFRPVAAGALTKGSALACSFVLLVAGLGVAYRTNELLVYVVGAYWVTNLSYSFLLKRVVLIDLMVIGLGFVLRVVAGSIISLVGPSSWLLLTTFLLALFLGIAKRRRELTLYPSTADRLRSVLREYEPQVLDQCLAISGGLVVITYALFTMSEYATKRYGSDVLIYTVPFVLYGIFRYLYLVYSDREDEDPLALVLRDRPLLICTLLWALACVVIVYWRDVLSFFRVIG